MIDRAVTEALDFQDDETAKRLQNAIAKRSKGYAEGEFGQVHYQICGDGAPLVLCHQSPSSSRQFEPAYARLAQLGFMAIGVDNPGFGQSDAPPYPPSIGDFADAAINVLDHLNIERADILGQHTGAMVAMEATIKRPERFRALILNGPTPFSPEQRKDWIDTLVARQRAWTLKSDGSHLQELWNRRVKASGNWAHLPAMHRHVVDMLIAGETLWYGHHASLVYDQSANLKNIVHPTLILNNTGDVMFNLCKTVREIRPDFEYVELEGGTHDIVDEQTEAWCAAVAAFLKTR